MVHKPTQAAAKAAAKATGKAKGVAKSLEGQAGILKHLTEEHGKAAMLMKRIVSSSEDSDVREDLFPKLKRDLLAHAKCEEREFYPVLEKYPALGDLVARSLGQHRHVEERLKRLSTGRKDTEDWSGEFELLARAVGEHVQLEEDQIFPRAKELISKEELSEMELRYERAEELVKSRL
jgi:hemerythrin superfamily protein